MSFLSKQFIDVIQWTEPEDGILAYRYPMEDMEIQNGGKLTVRDSQMAVFVNEGRVADVFAPGLYTLNTQTLPILTYLMNWDKAFKSPFKSDVYYFSTRLQTNQRWGTATPITIRDKEFGAMRMRGYGIYAYKIADPKLFYQKMSGTRDIYGVPDLEGQLRNTIVARMTDRFAQSSVPFLDMAANQAALGQKIVGNAEAVVCRTGLVARNFRGGKYLAARRAAEDAGSAHQHEHAWRYEQVHAVPGGADPAHRGGERRRWRDRGCGRRIRRGPDDGAERDECDEAGRAASASDGWSSARRGPRGAGRTNYACHRHQVLYQLREQDAARIEILPGVRHSAAIKHERSGVDRGGARV